MSMDDKKNMLDDLLKSYSSIPCLKEAIVYSLLGGGLSSLAYFLSTSNKSRINRVFITSFGLIYFGYFTTCRLYVFKRDKNTNFSDKIKEYQAKESNKK